MPEFAIDVSDDFSAALGDLGDDAASVRAAVADRQAFVTAIVNRTLPLEATEAIVKSIIDTEAKVKLAGDRTKAALLSPVVSADPNRAALARTDRNDWFRAYGQHNEFKFFAFMVPIWRDKLRAAGVKPPSLGVLRSASGGWLSGTLASAVRSLGNETIRQLVRDGLIGDKADRDNVARGALLGLGAAPVVAVPVVVIAAGAIAALVVGYLGLSDVLDTVNKRYEQQTLQASIEAEKAGKVPRGTTERLQKAMQKQREEQGGNALDRFLRGLRGTIGTVGLVGGAAVGLYFLWPVLMAKRSARAA